MKERGQQGVNDKDLETERRKEKEKENKIREMRCVEAFMLAYRMLSINLSITF